jgi:hypothetical protein
MRALSTQEQRTVRIGIAIVVAYLVLFYGGRGFTKLERDRAAYFQLRGQAQALAQQVNSAAKRGRQVDDLKRQFQMEPDRLSRVTLAAETSAALQKAAQQGGLQLGPVRESSGRSSVRELTSMQLEGSGPVGAVLSFVSRLQTLGYPVVVDSVQLTPDTAKPGTLKLNLTITILDYEQWKTTEGRHA